MKKPSLTEKSVLKIGLAAAGFIALSASEPAAADQWGVSISSNAVGFSYNSGGYCDSYGCPDRYWDYPVYYCPVYVHHRWYRGPVYYSRRHGGTMFWVRDGWHRDEWNGQRPPWACNDRYGPALDLYFYQSNGFRVRDTWWNSWGREHNDWYWRDHPDWYRGQNSGGARNLSQGEEWDRDRSWSGGNHPWSHASGQGSDQSGRNGGAMGAYTAPNSGGALGGDQGDHHRSTGGNQNSLQDQSGVQTGSPGGHRDHGTANGNTSSATSGQGSGQSGANSSNSGGAGPGQNPSSQSGGQGSDHGSDQGHHHARDTGGTGQGASPNGGAGGGMSGGRADTGKSNGGHSDGKGSGASNQGSTDSGNSGNAGNDQGGDHKNHGNHGDKGASPDNANPH